MNKGKRSRLSERGVFERKLTEEDVILQCRAILELNGFSFHRVVERIPWGRKTSEPGFPDAVVWKRVAVDSEINSYPPKGGGRLNDNTQNDHRYPIRRREVIHRVEGQANAPQSKHGSFADSYPQGYPQVCFIEFKRPGGKHRPAQTAWIEAARADGLIAFFASSVEEMVAGFAEFRIQIKGLS